MTTRARIDERHSLRLGASGASALGHFLDLRRFGRSRPTPTIRPDRDLPTIDRDFPTPKVETFAVSVSNFFI
jgi:hypothetical protein